MTRTPILNGQAVLLIDDGGVYGIEFPNIGSFDNPTEPARLSLTPSRTVAGATEIAQGILALLG